MTDAEVREAHKLCHKLKLSAVASQFGVSITKLRQAFSDAGLRVPYGKAYGRVMGEVRFVLPKEYADLIQSNPEVRDRIRSTIINVTSKILYNRG
jgi:hypothetical protein